MTEESILRLHNVSKDYTSGQSQLAVLNGVNLSIESGTSCALVGPSGSGKTTLLGVCAGLDSVSRGEITLLGQVLTKMSEDQLAKLRSEYVGFVFQSFQLIPTLTALENVMVPAELIGERNAEEKASELLSVVGLGSRLTHYPAQLSGGEQQRVAIARAYINTPKILFADEPTGNLDEETGAAIEELLFTLNKESGTTLLLATHDLTLARKTDRVLSMRAGLIVEDRSGSALELTQ